MPFVFRALPVVLILTACTSSSLYFRPYVTGEQDGKAVWTIHGSTDVGETSDEDSRRYALRNIREFCASEPTILSVYSTPAHNVIGDFLTWTARYTCP
ncbi:hypothetical protein GAY28_16530 [Azospirillum brasilense]|nr:hypothetical protein [Azospirillum brasilense]